MYTLGFGSGHTHGRDANGTFDYRTAIYKASFCRLNTVDAFCETPLETLRAHTRIFSANEPGGPFELTDDDLVALDRYVARSGYEHREIRDYLKKKGL